MPDRSCASCDFWDADRDRKRGNCRANPPVQTSWLTNARGPDGEMPIITNWPPTNPDDWCGRFSARPQPPQKFAPPEDDF